MKTDKRKQKLILHIERQRNGVLIGQFDNYRSQAMQSLFLKTRMLNLLINISNCGFRINYKFNKLWYLYKLQGVHFSFTRVR